MTLEKELVGHVEELIRRIDLVLARGERGRVSLEHELKDGTVIYRNRTVAVSKGREAQVLPTICTSTLILAKQDARPRLVEAVSNALSFEREKLLRVQ